MIPHLEKEQDVTGWEHVLRIPSHHQLDSGQGALCHRAASPEEQPRAAGGGRGLLHSNDPHRLPPSLTFQLSLLFSLL